MPDLRRILAQLGLTCARDKKLFVVLSVLPSEPHGSPVTRTNGVPGFATLRSLFPRLEH